MAYLFIITLINMRFTRGGKLMSRIKERVFLMLLLSIQRARSRQVCSRNPHTHAVRKRNVKRRHTRVRSKVHTKNKNVPHEKRKSVDDGGGGLTTRHQQQNKREEGKETSGEKNDEIWLSYVAV